MTLTPTITTRGGETTQTSHGETETKETKMVKVVVHRGNSPVKISKVRETNNNKISKVAVMEVRRIQKSCWRASWPALREITKLRKLSPKISKLQSETWRSNLAS